MSLNWESKLTPQEAHAYAQFFSAANGGKAAVVNGHEAVTFFARSGIPNEILSDIWETADRDNLGYLTPETFSIALKLIACAQHGHEVSEPILSTVVPLPQFEGFSPNATSPTNSGNDIITPGEREKYLGIFRAHQPIQGVLDAEKARNIFNKSNLPNEYLAQIWNLADLRKAGNLNQTEFIIAMHYIAKLMDRSITALPVQLPAKIYGSASGSIQSSPVLRRTSMSPATLMQQRQFTGSSISSIAPLPRAQRGRAESIESLGSMAFSINNTMPTASIATWDVTPQAKLQSDVFFNQIDTKRTGTIQGSEAVEFFKKSRLPDTELARVWDLADMEQNGQLTPDEFAVAMYLIQNRIAGKPLPNVLPKSLIPPSKAASSNRVTSPRQSIFQSPPSMTPPTVATTSISNITSSSSKPEAPPIAHEDLLGDFGNNEELTHETNAVNQLQYQIKNVETTASQTRLQKESVSNTLQQSRKQKQNIEAETVKIINAQKAEGERLVELRNILKSEEPGWNQIQQEHDAAQKQLEEAQQEVTKMRQTLEQGRTDSEHLRRRVHDVQEETAGLTSQLENLRIYVNKIPANTTTTTNTTINNEPAPTKDDPSTKLTFDDIFSPPASVPSPTASMTPKVEDDFDSIFAPQPTTAEKRQPPPPPPPSRRTTIRRQEAPQPTKKTRAPPPPPPSTTTSATTAGIIAAIHESDESESDSATTSDTESLEDEGESSQVETAPKIPSEPSEPVLTQESETPTSKYKNDDQISKVAENTSDEGSITATTFKDDVKPETHNHDEQRQISDNIAESDTKEENDLVSDKEKAAGNEEDRINESEIKEENDSVLDNKEAENKVEKTKEFNTEEASDIESTEKIYNGNVENMQQSDKPLEPEKDLVADNEAEEVKTEEPKQETQSEQEIHEMKAGPKVEEKDDTIKETSSPALLDDSASVQDAKGLLVAGEPEPLQTQFIGDLVSEQLAAEETAVEPPTEEERVTSEVLADKIIPEFEDSNSTASVSNQVDEKLEEVSTPSPEELKDKSTVSPECTVTSNEEPLQNQKEKKDDVPTVMPESPQDDDNKHISTRSMAQSKLHEAAAASETYLFAKTESFDSTREHPKEDEQGTGHEMAGRSTNKEESSVGNELNATAVADLSAAVAPVDIAAPVIEGTTTTLQSAPSKEGNQESSSDTILAKHDHEQKDEATASREKEEEIIDNEQQEVTESIDQEHQDVQDSTKEKDTESSVEDEFLSVDGDDTKEDIETYEDDDSNNDQKTIEDDSIMLSNTNMQDSKEEKPIDEQTEPRVKHYEKEEEIKTLQVDEERAQATTLSSKDTKEEGGVTGAYDAHSDGESDLFTSDKEDRLKGENNTHDIDGTPTNIVNPDSLLTNNELKEHVEEESLSTHNKETEQSLITHDTTTKEEEDRVHSTHEDFDAVFMERPTDKERTSSDGGGESFEIISSTASPNEKQQSGPTTDEFDAAFASELQDAKVINESSFFNQEDFDAAFAEELTDAKVVQNDESNNNDDNEKGASSSSRGNKLSWASNFGGFNFDDDFDTKKHDEWDSIFGGDDGKAGGTEHVGFQDAFSAPSFNDQDQPNTIINNNNNSNPFEAPTTSSITDAPVSSTAEESSNYRENQQEKGIPNTGNSNLDQLVIMGFDRDLAKEALDRYDQDLEKATNFLLDLAAK